MPGATHDSPLAMATQQPKDAAMDKSWARTYAWPAIRTFIVTKPLGTIGGALILVMVLTAVCAEVLAPKVDLILQRVMDVMLAFPLLILALVIVNVLGRSIPNVVLAIAIPMIPRTTRIVRASALAIKEYLYVEAAQVVGSPCWRVMARHILPNVIWRCPPGQAVFIYARQRWQLAGARSPRLPSDERLAQRRGLSSSEQRSRLRPQRISHNRSEDGGRS